VVNDDDPERNIYRRSVLLFNTWKEAPYAIDRAVETVNEGKHGNVQCNSIHNWDLQEFSMGRSTSTSIESPQVDDTTSIQHDASRKVRMKIGILGDRIRRERADRYLKVFTTTDAKQAFLDNNTVASFPVTETC
jgi:hypothetical protein